MISGISSSSYVASGNLNALKKAIDTEETLMNSVLEGAQGSQSLQANATPSPTPSQANPTNSLDITA